MGSYFNFYRYRWRGVRMVLGDYGEMSVFLKLLGSLYERVYWLIIFEEEKSGINRC